jgi:thiosulfate/3-mercaptopyruvate sulfurtransferase
MKGKRVLLFLVVCALALLVLSGTALAKDCSVRSVQPIVSTAWLAANLDRPGLVIADVRMPGATAYIPGSISEPGFPVGGWSVGLPEDPPGTLWMEVPATDDLFALLGAKGITSESTVVVVGAPADAPNPPKYGWADVTRVAATLIYAGVKNVAVLDGGFPKWYAEGRETVAEPAVPTPVTYSGQVLSNMFVSTEYVQEHICRSIIIDARDLDVYLGKVTEPWAPPGHIPSARPLPTPWIWATDAGIYRATPVLRLMAAAVIGPAKDKEIIVYCGVGGYGSSWWFVLAQVLGYQNVKFYDGSAQGWALAGNTFVDWTP